MKNKHEIIITIEGKEWQDAIDKAFVKKQKEVNIDGFRPGKAPREVFEKKFGKEALFNDAIDIVLPVAYTKALKDSKLEPIVQPAIDIKEITNDAVSFIFIITTKPEIKIKKYQKLGVKKEAVKVTKKDVEAALEQTRLKFADLKLKDEKIVSGDTAVINFEGFLDGVPFEGGKGENYNLEIGSNTFIPGFEEQLIGMKANEAKDVEVTFPKEYPSENLAGKPVTFKVLINEVKSKVVPELNDDFFADLAIDGVKSTAELEEYLENDLKAKKEYEAENLYIDTLLEKVSKEVEVEIPEELIHDEVHRMMHQYEENLKMQGITLEQFYQFTNSNSDMLHEQMEPEAKTRVLYRLMLEEIAKLEKIEVTEENTKEEAKKLSEKYNMTEKEFLEAFGGLEMIKYDLQMRQTIEFLKNNN